MNTAEIESSRQTAQCRTSCGVMGFICAVAACLIPSSITALVIDSNGAAELIRASIFIQIVVGLLFNAIVYYKASNDSFKLGMRLCYALIVGLIVAVGGYTILTSLVRF